MRKEELRKNVVGSETGERNKTIKRVVKVMTRGRKEESSFLLSLIFFIPGIVSVVFAVQTKRT